MAVQSKAAIFKPLEHCSFSKCVIASSVLGAVLIIFLIFLIAITPTWPPDVQVKSISIESIRDVSSTQLTANWTVSFQFGNPNRKSLSYDPIAAYIVHHRHNNFGGDSYSLSNSTGVLPFKQGSGRATFVEAKFEDVRVGVDDGWSLLNDGTGVVKKLNVVVWAVVEYGGRWRWTLRFRKGPIRVDCDALNVMVALTTPPKAIILGSTWCHVNRFIDYFDQT